MIRIVQVAVVASLALMLPAAANAAPQSTATIATAAAPNDMIWGS